MQNYNVLLYVAFIIGGLVFIGAAINQYMKAKKAEKTWLTVPGAVLNSEVKISRHHGSKGRTTVTYEPTVSYQYKIKNQSYNGNHIGFGTTTYSKGKAEKIIALYPMGSPVTVHYDPADPSQAVLETKAKAGVTFLALGIILIVLGVFSLVRFTK
jgi:hypothetical protein